jgi:hypothetical protein
VWRERKGRPETPARLAPPGRLVSLARPALKARKGFKALPDPLERLARPVWLEPPEAPARLALKAPKALPVWLGPLVPPARRALQVRRSGLACLAFHRR